MSISKSHWYSNYENRVGLLCKFHRSNQQVLKSISDSGKCHGGRTLSYRWPPKISKLSENDLWFLLIFMLVDSNQLLSRSSATIAEPSAVIAPEYEKWKVYIKSFSEHKKLLENSSWAQSYVCLKFWRKKFHFFWSRKMVHLGHIWVDLRSDNDIYIIVRS